MNIKKQLLSGKNIYELPLKVCYYARVSTEHIDQLSSITNQVSYFKTYVAGINNWQLVASYIDEGISGKATYNRKQFINMINDAKLHKFDLILTKSVSRFARNTIDSIYYTNLLLDIGIGVYFLNDNINTFYSDSEFRLTLMASIAQDELRKLSESVRFGLKQSIKRGVVLGSNNLLGYYKYKGRLIVNEKEAIIVRNIFNQFIKNTHNYSKIARLINKKYNKRFTSTSIKRILTNPKYKGYYCGKKSEVLNYKNNKRKYLEKGEWIIYRDYDRVPPIVKEELWNMVNNIIEYSKNTYIDIYKNKVFCKIHGKVMTKVKKYKNKYYYYYICKDCFRISSNLLKIMTKDIIFKRIIITKSKLLKIDIVY